MGVDFRPINYFGVTGINIKAGSGGQRLYDGMQINTIPHGNFTLQALLTRLGETTTGVVTPQLIHVIDWATRYTDALNPLVETMLIAANAVAEVQNVSTKQLLLNATAISVAFPTFLSSAVNGGSGFIAIKNIWGVGLANETENDYRKGTFQVATEAETGLFGSVGNLLSSHASDLYPVTELVRTLSDTVPALIRPEETSHLLKETRTRLEKMYQGTPDQRALQVRVVLDSLPGVAAPLAAEGGP
jgi:hypothetical protein